MSKIIKTIKRSLGIEKAVVANSIDLNKDTEPLIDEIPTLIQIAPFGVYEKDGVEQICDKLAFENIIQFSKLPVLIDANHDSLHGKSDAYGWVRKLDIYNDGLYGNVEWTPLGEDAIRNHILRSISPAWYLDEEGRPEKLHSIGLTNTPNIEDIQPLFNSNEKEENIIMETEEEVKKEEPVVEEEVKDNTENSCNEETQPVEENATEDTVEEVKENDEVEDLKKEIEDLKAQLAEYKAKEEREIANAMELKKQLEAESFVKENSEFVEDTSKLKEQYLSNPEATKTIFANLKKVQPVKEPVCKKAERLTVLSESDEYKIGLANCKTTDEKIKFLESRNWNID